MSQAILRSLALASCVLFATFESAQAKTVPMGTLSRGQVRSACERAGGRPFGMEDTDASYGCYGAIATVACTPDSDCIAVVRDTVPVTGSSLDYVLNLGQNASGPDRVRPLGARINPVVQP